MPRLPQYISTAQPSGIVRGVVPSSPHVGGLVAGITQGAHAVQRGEDIRAAQMERERQRIAEEEAKAAVSLTMSEGRAYWTEQLVNAQQNTADAAGFTQRTLKDFDAWSQKAIEAAPEDARSHLAARLQDLKLSVHERAFSFEADSRRAKVVDDFSTGLDAARRTAQADPSQFAPLMAEQLAAANALTLDPKSKAKLLESTRETIAFDTASGIVGRDPDAFLAMSGMAGGKSKDGKPLPADPAKAAKAVSDNPILSNLRPEHLHSLVERATMLSINRQNQIEAERERARARAEAAANRAERDAGRAYTILRDMQMDGRKIDPANPENKLLMQQMQAVPAYAKAFSEMAAAVPANAAAAVQPLAVQRAELSSLYAQRNKSGTSPGLEAEISRREKVLNSATADYAKEPLTAAADRGVIVSLTPVDTSTLDGIERGFTSRAVQADTVKRKTGAPVSPLTSVEAARWADMVNALPGTERGPRIAAMTAIVGPQQAQALAAQIDAKDRALSLEIAVGATRTTQGRTVGELIRRGAQVAKDRGIKEDKSAEFGLHASLAKEVGPMLNGRARDDVIDAARYIMLAKQEAGEKMDYAGAIELAVGGKIIEHNGKRLPAPPQFTEERFAASLAAMKPQDIASRVIFTPAGGTLTPEEFLARLPGAELESAGTGRYYVKAPGGYLLDENMRSLAIEVR